MKKIIDIIPPKGRAKNFVNISKESKKKTKKKRVFLIPLAIFIVIVACFFLFFEGRGKVTVYPETFNIGFEETIHILAEESDNDFENNIIAGEYFQEVLDFEDEYEATGSDETATKAEGEITVCNEHPSGKSLNLIKNTRFLSSEGDLTYRAASAFSIPAMTGDEPGCVSVAVIADEVGEEYNLSTGTFSIPGLKNTEYYTTTWAEILNGQSIDGGSTSEQRIIVTKDLEKAEDSFREQYLEEAKQSLKEKLDNVNTFIYLDDDFEQTIDNLIIMGSEGDKVDSFKVEGTITTKVLVFRKSDIEKYISAKLNLSEEGKEIVPDTLSKEFEKDSEASDYALTLTVSAKSYAGISETFILNDIKGQTLEDAKEILQNMEGVQSAEVSESLFWKNRLPNNKENIDLEIKFEE